MLDTLLEFPMVFLPQVSLIWHLVFMFFLPPPPFPKLLSLHFPIVLHLYTFATSPFTPFPSLYCVPTPASLSSFLLCCSFYGYPLATTHYLILTPQPLDSPSHPPASTCPPNPPFSLFHHFMDQIHYYGLTVPQ